MKTPPLLHSSNGNATDSLPLAQDVSGALCPPAGQRADVGRVLGAGHRQRRAGAGGEQAVGARGGGLHLQLLRTPGLQVQARRVHLFVPFVTLFFKFLPI